jgi:hypothetical protein
MDTELTRNLSYRLFPLDGFESHLGLKCCVALSSHVDHFTIPPCGLWQVKMHLIALSSFWGPVHIPSSPLKGFMKKIDQLEQRSFYNIKAQVSRKKNSNIPH